MRVTVDRFEFDIPNALDIYKFDEKDKLSPHYHGVSCLKAVDVMVEMPNCYIFVEIKEYEQQEIAKMMLQKGMEKGSATHWLKNNLRQKYKDTLLYRYCENKLDKDVVYVCLLNFDPALLILFRKKLIEEIPVGIVNKKRWAKPLLNSIIVVDENAWNRNLTAKGFGTCHHV